VAQRAFDRRLGSGGKRDEAPSAGALRDAPEQRWPMRWRFLFIFAAAALCWIIPAVIVYLVLARY
jgi:hypothetical protein